MAWLEWNSCLLPPGSHVQVKKTTFHSPVKVLGDHPVEEKKEGEKEEEDSDQHCSQAQLLLALALVAGRNWADCLSLSLIAPP